MYTPDNVFVKRLKTLDKKLGCNYEQSHGHFVVTYRRAHGGSVPIMIVKGKDGGFRQPDNRDLTYIMSGDRQNSTARKKIESTAKYMEDYRAKKKKRVAEEFRDRTKDDKNQLMNVMTQAAGAGKGNSTYRRVEPKPKGQKFA
ncbi:MAG: hypothetical protein JJV89_02000 [Desulfosarcina sp.]|nr:hypothetical protein [Desulfobacterales bacterium]